MMVAGLGMVLFAVHGTWPFSILAKVGKPPAMDLMRARSTVPRKHLYGTSAGEAVRKLNARLLASLPDGIEAKACEAWDVEDLTQLLEIIHGARDHNFENIYQEARDNRRLGNQPIELRRQWADEMVVAGKAPDIVPILRDGRCFDVVKWWIHHVRSDHKKELASAVPFLPLLPTNLTMFTSRLEGPLSMEGQGQGAQVIQSAQAAYSAAACHGLRGDDFRRSDKSADSGSGEGRLPVPWPLAFSVKFASPVTAGFFGKNTTGTFSLVPGLAERIALDDGSYDHLCTFLHTNTSCTQLTVNGFRYLDFPKRQTCCRCCTYAEGDYPCGGPLSSGFLRNETGHITYKGRTTVAGQDCDWWGVMGTVNMSGYYALADERNKTRHGMPFMISNPNYLRSPEQRADDLYIFDPNTYTNDVDIALFNVPSRCRDAPYCGIEPCAPVP